MGLLVTGFHLEGRLNGSFFLFFCFFWGVGGADSLEVTCSLSFTLYQCGHIHSLLELHVAFLSFGR